MKLNPFALIAKYQCRVGRYAGNSTWVLFSCEMMLLLFYRAPLLSSLCESCSQATDSVRQPSVCLTSPQWHVYEHQVSTTAAKSTPWGCCGGAVGVLCMGVAKTVVQVSCLKSLDNQLHATFCKVAATGRRLVGPFTRPSARLVTIANSIGAFVAVAAAASHYVACRQFAATRPPPTSRGAWRHVLIADAIIDLHCFAPVSFIRSVCWRDWNRCRGIGGDTSNEPPVIRFQLFPSFELRVPNTCDVDPRHVNAALINIGTCVNKDGLFASVSPRLNSGFGYNSSRRLVQMNGIFTFFTWQQRNLRVQRFR